MRSFHRQHRYGIPAEDAIQVDGNDVLAVYHAVKMPPIAFGSAPSHPPRIQNVRHARPRGGLRHQVLPEGLIDHGDNRPCGTPTEWGLQNCLFDEALIEKVRTNR